MDSNNGSILHARLTDFLSEYEISALEKYLTALAFVRGDDEPVKFLNEIYPIHKIGDSNYYKLMEIRDLMSPLGLSHYIPLSVLTIINRFISGNPYKDSGSEEDMFYDWFHDVNDMLGRQSSSPTKSRNSLNDRMETIFDIWSAPQRITLKGSLLWIIEGLHFYNVDEEDIKGFKEFSILL